MAFLPSAAIGVPSRLWKAFPGPVDSISEDVLFSIPFRVRKFVYSVELFQIVHQCSIKVFIAFLAYRRSSEIDCEHVRRMGYFSYKAETGDVLSTPPVQATGEKLDRKYVLVTEVRSQVAVIHKSSDRTTLSDLQGSVRAAWTEEQNNEDDGLSVNGHEHEEESADGVGIVFP